MTSLTAGDRGRMLAGATLVNLCLGSLYAWSLFVEPLETEFASSSSALAGVFSVAVATFAVVVLACGALVDRTSPGRLVATAAAAATTGMLVGARADALPWIVVGYGLLFGIANGLGYATAVAVGGKAFGRTRGSALGIIVSAYAAGPLLASPIITALLDAVGWRRTFVVLGLGIGVLLLVAAALLAGHAPTEAASSAAATGMPVDRRSSARPLLLRPAGILIWLGFLSGALPAMLVIAHAATIADAGGLSRATASVAVAALAAGNLVGRAGGGWLSDHVGRLPGLRVATTTLALACLALATVAGPGPVITVLTVIGMAYGAQASLVPAATADMFGARDFGANFGRVFTGWGVAGVMGPQLGAGLGDTPGGLALALRVSAASAMLALLAYVAITHVGGAIVAAGDERSGAGA